MDRPNFPGFPAYMARAAEALGLAPEAAGSPPPAMASMANLCAQASTADPVHAPAILERAAAFRDRLLVAARAAELMLAEATRPSPEDEASARPRPARPTGRPNHHRA